LAVACCRYLRDKIRVASVVSESPPKFLNDMATTLGIDTKPLRFAYSRLNSLLRTLQVRGARGLSASRFASSWCVAIVAASVRVHVAACVCR